MNKKRDNEILGIIMNMISSESNKESNSNPFNNFQFPSVRLSGAKTIAESLETVTPKTIEEVAGDREVKPYPAPYKDFDSLEDIKLYIVDFLDKNPQIHKSWLEANIIVNMPFNIDEDVYYTSYSSLNVKYSEPTDNDSYWNDIKFNSGSIVELNPEKWSLNDIENIVKNIIQEYGI